MKTFYEMLELMEADQEMALGNQDGGSSNQDASGETVDQGQSPEDAQNQQDMMQGQETQASEPKHYMFFSNLKVIRDKADAILAMDPSQVDAMLGDGHDWAADHIATSKDDVEEVYNWLSSSVDAKS
jgi:hypothetical protein